MCAPLFAVCVTVKPDRLELTAPTRRNLKRDRGMGTSSCLIGDQGTLFNPAFSLSLVIFVSMHFFLLLLAVKFIINSGLTVSNYEFDRHRFHRQVKPVLHLASDVTSSSRIDENSNGDVSRNDRTKEDIADIFHLDDIRQFLRIRETNNLISFDRFLC